MLSRAFLLGGAVPLLAVFAAHAAVLCARPHADGTFNTSVKIREACRPSEAQLDPAALGLQGPPGPLGPAGAEGPTGPAGPAATLRDANGVLVGVVTRTEGLSSTTVQIVRGLPDGRAAKLRYDGGVNVQSTVDATLYFSQPGCGGPAYYGPPPSDPISNAAVQNGILYFSVGGGVTVSFQSWKDAWHSLGSCAAVGGVFSPPDSCCLPAAGSGGFYATDTVNLTALVPPFHVEGP